MHFEQLDQTGWRSGPSEPSVVRTHALFFASLVGLLSAAPAFAQDAEAGSLHGSSLHASPRAGRLMSLFGEAPGVWVAPNQIYAASEADYISACAPGRGCARVVEATSCRAPRCPGAGSLHTVAENLAEVSLWPTDHDGHHHELELLRRDPRLADLPMSDHPDHEAWEARRERAEAAGRDERLRHEESVRWVSRHRDEGERLELAFGTSIATLSETGGVYAGASASAGLVYLLDSHDAAAEDDEAVWNFFFGDVLGAELRAHFLYRLDGTQAAEWMTLVGVGPVLENRFEHSVVRIPTYIGLLLPEFGVALRADRDATWYVAWSAPLRLLVHHDLAVDFVGRVFVVDEWEELAPTAPEDAADPVEVIVALSVGLRLP